MGKKKKKSQRLCLGIFNLLALLQWPVAAAWAGAGIALITMAIRLSKHDDKTSTIGMLLILALGSALAAKFSASIGRQIWGKRSLSLISFKLSAINLLIGMIGTIALWQVLSGGNSLFFLVSFAVTSAATRVSWQTVVCLNT